MNNYFYCVCPESGILLEKDPNGDIYAVESEMRYGIEVFFHGKIRYIPRSEEEFLSLEWFTLQSLPEYSFDIINDQGDFAVKQCIPIMFGNNIQATKEVKTHAKKVKEPRKKKPVYHETVMVDLTTETTQPETPDTIMHGSSATEVVFSLDPNISDQEPLPVHDL